MSAPEPGISFHLGTGATAAAHEQARSAALDALRAQSGSFLLVLADPAGGQRSIGSITGHADEELDEHEQARVAAAASERFMRELSARAAAAADGFRAARE